MVCSEINCFEHCFDFTYISISLCRPIRNIRINIVIANDYAYLNHIAQSYLWVGLLCDILNWLPK